MIREDFLYQSAYDPVDRFCPLDKARWMLKAILDFYDGALAGVRTGLRLEQVMGLPVVGEIARMKELEPGQAARRIEDLAGRIRSSFAELGVD